MPLRHSTDPITTIIENARVYTMDHDLPHAEAIAVRDDRVIAVGARGDLDSLRGEKRRVDAAGRAIIPGLIDAHIHFLQYSRSLAKIDLDGVKSKEEVLARVTGKARELGPGRWILGGGWNNNLWSPPDFPTRHDLDRVAPDNPVYLDRKDLHSCWVNSLALQHAAVTRDTPDPPGAAVGRDDAGEPDGMFYESAVRIMRDAIDEPPEEPVKAMRRGFSALAAMGITGFHDCEGPDAFAAFQALDAAGELPLRVIILLAYYRLEEAISTGLTTGFGSDYLRTGPVKIFSDGSLGSMTAEMLEEYECCPGNRGIGTIPQDELEAAIAQAAAAGIPSAIHAIGDAANRRVLDAFQRAGETLGKQHSEQRLRHRIEHAQLLHPDDIPRLAQLGVTASMQPLHATSDMQAADRLWGARSRYGYAWRSVLDSGALLAFGSDAPVETPDPFAGMHAAVTRQDRDDQPPEGWYPQERITVEEAVRAYTEGAARSCPYLPHVTGTLAPGSAADLVVLDRDVFTIDPREIKHAVPVATLVAGRPVYDPGGLLSPQ
jgi:predicted amidohydrolase YtcJ